MFQTHQLLIDWAVATSGLSHRELHVHAGLALYLLARLLAPRSRLFAFSAVAMIGFGHEVIDYLADAGWQPEDSIGDMVATLAWPAVLSMFGSISSNKRSAPSRRSRSATYSRIAIAPSRRSIRPARYRTSMI